MSKIKFYPKVLVGTPTSSIKDYCWDEFISRVKSLSYPNYDFVLVDNTDGRKHLKKLRQQNINVEEVKPKYKSVFSFLAESHEALRIKALKGGYQYLLHLESDVIPPQDVIERLMLHKKKVVSAMYFIEFGSDSHLMLIDSEKNPVEVLETNVMKHPSDFMFMNGQLKKVHSAALGCTLIHKQILKHIPFRHQEGINMPPDAFFANDLSQKNIGFYVDTSILCEHRNLAWTRF